MSTYHARLALDYFHACNTAERTEAVLHGIVVHIVRTYALSPDDHIATLEQALRLAHQRGLLPAPAPVDPLQARLAVEFLEGRPPQHRTAATLRDYVAQLSAVWRLTPTERDITLALTLALARAQGLLTSTEEEI